MDHGRCPGRFLEARPELFLHQAQGLQVGAYRSERARPDGLLVPAEALLGEGHWAAPEKALLVLEVTSYDSQTDGPAREEKPRAYAETGIPVYLLIDREAGEVVVHSEPDGVRYERTTRVPFGKNVELPEPVGITLETEPLKNWVR